MKYKRIHIVQVFILFYFLSFYFNFIFIIFFIIYIFFFHIYKKGNKTFYVTQHISNVHTQHTCCIHNTLQIQTPIYSVNIYMALAMYNTPTQQSVVVAGLKTDTLVGDAS